MFFNSPCINIVWNPPYSMASNSTSDDSVPSEQDTPMDDSILFDGEGNIQSAQKKTPENDKQPDPGPERLSSDNFRIVREHADEVRVLTVTKDNLRHFQDTNLRLFAQNARPRWMGKPLSPPILPGNVCFPEDFHSDWGKTLKKFETKFQRKVNKYLPSLIESLDSSIMKKRNDNLEKVISSVIDTSPGQKRRAEAIFLRLCSRTERVPLPGSRQRRHHPNSNASGSSDNSFSSWLNLNF